MLPGGRIERVEIFVKDERSFEREPGKFHGYLHLHDEQAQHPNLARHLLISTQQSRCVAAAVGRSLATFV